MNHLDPLGSWLRTQAAELVAQEAEVRAGHDDAVHHMRVATRRLHSCFRTFQPAFVANSTRHLGGELAWLAGRLGEERDVEMTRSRIEEDVEKLSRKNVLVSVTASLRTNRNDAFVAAHHRLMEALDSNRFQLLVEELAGFALAPPLVFPRKKTRWLRRRLRKAMRRTERLVARAESLHGSRRDAALHEVRKQAKHVRYAAETLVLIEGKRAKQIAKRFASIQEILGEHHDAVVTRQTFRDEQRHAKENAFTFGALFARENARATAAERAFKKAWKRSRGRLP
jgi:CHAD domain-containing protein